STLKIIRECKATVKRERVRPLLASASKQELAFATRLLMQAAGERDAALTVKQVTTCSPRRATRLKKSLARQSELAKNPLTKPWLFMLSIKKWSVRRVDRPVVDAHKKEVQEKFRRQMGLLVDAPKPGLGTTNNGYTARAFFRNPLIASSITGIDEMLIRKLHVVLTTTACGHEIDAQKFKEFCLAATEVYVALYLWYNMPQSLHKVLIHGGLLVHDSILPIGQMSEEAIEARNKDSKYLYEHHSHKFNRKQSIEDMIQMLLVSSDPYITQA
ncbi:dna-mediated transposase, partial [Trichonephila inaurata madagascariensis]